MPPEHLLGQVLPGLALVCECAGHRACVRVSVDGHGRECLL